MPNRAKRAAVRQTQLGQRRRKDRKDRPTSTQAAELITHPTDSPSNDTHTDHAVHESEIRTTPQAGTARPVAANVPAQPYLKSDLIRIGVVAIISTGIVVGSAMVL